MASRDKTLALISIAVILVLISILLIALTPRETPSANESLSVNGTHSVNTTTSESNTTSDLPIENLGSGWYQLSDEQKMLTEAIAFREMSENPHLNHTYGTNGAVGRIDVDVCHEVAPGLDRTRYLPYVEFLIGNASQSGVNALVYVDLDERRAVYLGFINRSIPNDTQRYFISRADMDGVMGSIIHKNGITPESYYNVTIAPSLHQHGLSEADLEELQAIAENNDTVQAYLKEGTDAGANFSKRWYLQSSGGLADGHSYISVYPVGYYTPVMPDGSPVYWRVTVTFGEFDDNLASVYKYTDYPRFYH